MWGSWFVALFGVTVALVAVLMALVVGASPIFAVVLVVVAVVAAGAFFLARRGVQAAQDETAGGEALRGRDASGAPVAGEGGPPPPGA